MPRYQKNPVDAIRLPMRFQMLGVYDEKGEYHELDRPKEFDHVYAVQNDDGTVHYLPPDRFESLYPKVV